MRGKEMARKLRLTPVLLSVIAGIGHLVEGRDLKGLVLFALFASGLAGTLEGLFLWYGPGKSVVTAVSASVALGAWVYSLWDILRLSYEPWREKNRLRRKEHIRRGTIAFLRGEYETAERELLAALRLDPNDPDSLFRLAVLARVRGETGRASRYLRALRRVDLAGKWAWEREREEELLAEQRKKKA